MSFKALEIFSPMSPRTLIMSYLFVPLCNDLLVATEHSYKCYLPTFFFTEPDRSLDLVPATAVAKEVKATWTVLLWLVWNTRNDRLFHSTDQSLFHRIFTKCFAFFFPQTWQVDTVLASFHQGTGYIASNCLSYVATIPLLALGCPLPWEP